MEQALMAVCKDIRLGKILIQTNHDSGEPEVLQALGVMWLITALFWRLKDNLGFWVEGHLCSL